MTRGNQRELARAKNQKKLADQKKKSQGTDKGTLDAKKQRDADIMREKQAAALAKKDGSGGQAEASGAQAAASTSGKK